MSDAAVGSISNIHTGDYDLIVIGGGVIGLSTAWHAGLRGLKTLVLESYGVLNDQGSSAGASRQFRLQYAQNYMSELAISSQQYWAELQWHTQKTLVQQVGSLWFGDPSLSSQEGGIEAAETVMDELSIPYNRLDAGEIETQFGFKNLPPDYSGFFQANGGIIDLKAAEEALFDAALATGNVDVHEYEPVSNIESLDGGEIIVSSAVGTYHAGKLAVCAGPYTNQALAPLGLEIGLDIWQMSSAYFKKTDPDFQLPTWFVFQKPQSKALFYGFPEVDWAHPGYIRVATDFPDNGLVLTNPNQRAPAPSPESLALDAHWVGEHMSGLDPTPRFTSTCLIALSQNQSRELLLDYAPTATPNNNNIVVYTAGWAAKFIPILGDMINQMLAGPVTDFNYGSFSIDRSNFSIDWIVENT